MKRKKYYLDSQSAQNILAIASKISGKLKAGDIILLKGSLGVGKTYFARNLIVETLKFNKIWDEVPSPSFSLIQIYDTLNPKVCHVDLYRISFLSELEELGLEDLYDDFITLIEWPERLGNRLPSRFLEIEFSFSTRGEDKRNLAILFEGSNWDHISVPLIQDS